MPGRASLQNNPARALFTAEQWGRIEQNPTARIDDVTWQGFNGEQKSALLTLRKQLTSDGFGGEGRRGDRDRIQGGDGGQHWAGRADALTAGAGRGRSVQQVIDQAKAAPGNARVKEPWDALPDNRMMVMSLNVENLFREADDPAHDDREFTEAVGYTKQKFYTHLDNIGTLLKSVNGGRGPDIVGLVEVEDKRALEKLVGNELAGMGYNTIALEEGHDRRGIDVGLITKYSLWGGTQPRLIFPEGNTDGQRGVLRVELNVKDKRTVVYVNHWKSMRDGEDVSANENSRIAAALKADLAATTAADPNVTVMVIGDLNTKFYGGNQKAMNTLGPTKTGEGVAANGLWDATNTFPARRAEGVDHPLVPDGTHGFRGENDFLDRFMVNGNAARGTGGLKLDPDSLVVVPTPGRYFGRGGGADTMDNGVSDHKPLVAQFEIS